MKVLKKCLINLFVLFCQMISCKNKRIVFISFNGKSYSDNPRAISEKLHALLPEAEIVWLFNDINKKRNNMPEYVKMVNTNNTWQYYATLASAQVLISNFTLPDIPKHKKQMFIQTWHGDKAFKKVLHDSSFVSIEYRVPEEKQGYCDYAIAGSEYGVNQYRSAFKYSGEIINVGTPRNDKLVNVDINEVKKTKADFELDETTKLLLYAPTLRRKNCAENKAMEVKDLDVSTLLDELEKRDSCKWMCLLRAHPSICDLSISGDDNRICNVSDYEDMADLMLISDMLITDYSSCAGDFALLNRPVILFQPDRNEYMEKDRSFYFKMEDSPYFIAETNDEVFDIVDRIDKDIIEDNCEAILDFYGNTETGKASETVVNIIKDWLDMK